MKITKDIKADIAAVFDRDPAASNIIEVILTYSGLHAVIIHRFSHGLFKLGLRTIPRIISQLTRFLTGVEIHPGAKISNGFFIDHGMGVVIGETTEIGENVTLYQGVTLGGTGKEKGKRHPTIGDSVFIGAGARILGSLTIGNDVRVGAGSVILDDVPGDSTVVGVPGRVVIKDGEKTETKEQNYGNLPDPLGERVKMLEECMKRIEEAKDNEYSRVS
jgi:serine O-acetyltransferase